MKTLLHLIETTGPGGAETVFINLVTAFDSDQYRSIPLVSQGGWVDRTLQSRGLTSVTSRSKGSFNLPYLRAIVQLVQKERVDLIQAHLPGANVYASLAGMITRTPVVSIFHGSVDLTHDVRLQRAKSGVINHGSARIIAVSEHLREELQHRTTLDRAKMRVIYNGVDTRWFTPGKGDVLRRELGLDSDAFVVCSVGNIRSAKGYDLLIEAASRTSKEAPHIHYVIAGQGKGDLYAKLLKQRSERDVEPWVHFLGFRDDTREIYASSNLFLLPSTSEGFSISTIEAMASGVPVVATRSGGPEEILQTGVDGVLVEAGSARAIASGVLDLAADPQRREDLANAAVKSVARRFSLTAMIEVYARLYGAVLRS